MSTRHVALCILLLPGCAPRSAPVAASPAGARSEAAELPSMRDPRSVGTIVMLDVTFPEAGTRVGTQLAGLQYNQRVGDLRVTDAVRYRWTREARESA